MDREFQHFLIPPEGLLEEGPAKMMVFHRAFEFSGLHHTLSADCWCRPLVVDTGVPRIFAEITSALKPLEN